MASTFVDVRHAGGAVVVSGSEFLDMPVVRVEFPGQNPVPLFPHEARALARELQAYATAADKRNARRAGKSTTGEDQNISKENQS